MDAEQPWLAHFRRPRHTGDLPGATHVGCDGVPGRGNYMVVRLRVADGVIEEARFASFGCPAAIAAGSALMGMAVGRSLDQAAGVTEADLLAVLGELPLGKGRVPGLAIRALRMAAGAGPPGAAGARAVTRGRVP